MSSSARFSLPRDPLFVLLVLIGPVAHGGVEGWRGMPWRWVVGVWLGAGLLMTVADWIVNREDVAFHLVLALVMALLAIGAWVGAHEIARRRSDRVASEPAL
jgi:hypothetical protein